MGHFRRPRIFIRARKNSQVSVGSPDGGYSLSYPVKGDETITSVNSAGLRDEM